jgi:hypothetical protein
VQAANEPPSRLHSNELPGSLAVKPKLGDELLLGSFGLETIAAAGPVVSTVNVLGALTPVLPPTSDCSACAV